MPGVWVGAALLRRSEVSRLRISGGEGAENGVIATQDSAPNPGLGTVPGVTHGDGSESRWRTWR